MRYIKGIRIWPPPRYPWIHKAKKILLENGREAFDLWSDSLTEEQKDELAAEVINLLARASGKTREEVARAIQEGRTLDL